jgi:hypothetical protein
MLRGSTYPAVLVNNSLRKSALYEVYSILEGQGKVRYENREEPIQVIGVNNTVVWKNLSETVGHAYLTGSRKHYHQHSNLQPPYHALGRFTESM